MAGGKKTAADAKAATTNADPALAAQILCALVSGNSHNHSADPEDAKEVVSKAYAIAEAFATHE